MTSTNKFTWGVLLNISGGVLFLGGIALSFTLIGACLGIPMALVGFPMLIWGTVWLFQAQSQRSQEAIAADVQQGLQHATFREASAAPILQINAPPPLSPANPLAVSPMLPADPPPGVWKRRIPRMPASRASHRQTTKSRNRKSSSGKSTALIWLALVS